MTQWSMPLMPIVFASRSGGCRSLVEAAVLHDGQEGILSLQALDVGERIAVDEQEVGEVARLDLPELAGPAHDLAAHARGCHQRLRGSEAQHVDEEQEITGVGPVRVPGEAVVAAREDADTPL